MINEKGRTMQQFQFSRYLLDCTLRDGGYANDWAFGRDNIINIFERQVSSGVDMIEVGFLDERRACDPDRTIQPDTQSFSNIFGALDRGNAMTVAMIDYGTCGIEKLQPQQEQWLDGIRVIFKKEKMHQAIDFCKQVKALGYKVFVQAVSITSYNDEELEQLVSLVNDCVPFAMSMVDTYGLLDAVGIKHICSVIDENLAPDIMLGYHAHNNFQLGYANAVSMLNSGINRRIVVDGSLYGMGKSAGNAPIELIAMYMNQNLGKRYSITQMQEAIASSILDIYKKQPWGYTLFYYIAASNNCHPDYVSYLMNKRTLSVTAINDILQRIPSQDKLGKNMSMIERLYLEYQSMECDDTVALQQLGTKLRDKLVLVLGPGATIETKEEDIMQYIQTERPFVMAINYIPTLQKPDCLFVTNSHRYLQITGKLASPEYSAIPEIATSNVTRTGGKFQYVVNYSALIDEAAVFPDNSMIMLLKLLRCIGVKHVALAGFDGYTPDTINYFDKNMEYSFIKEKAESINDSVRKFLAEYTQNIRVTFVTPSQYTVQ